MLAPGRAAAGCRATTPTDLAALLADNLQLSLAVHAQLTFGGAAQVAARVAAQVAALRTARPTAYPEPAGKLDEQPAGPAAG